MSDSPIVDNGVLEQYLHEHIPISRAMGAQVETADQAGVRLIAPLAPNINHRETVFGGSLSALGILAGWTLIHARLRAVNFKGRLVIQRSATDFLKPAGGAFAAFCPSPAAAEWAQFVRALHRKGRARITLSGELLSGCSDTGAETVVGTFQGTYVALAIRD
jgi:thioesterase domain-containing protein